MTMVNSYETVSSSNEFASGAGGSSFSLMKSTQCCQRLATAATFLREELCCTDPMTRIRARKLDYTPQRNATSLMKDLILNFFSDWHQPFPHVLAETKVKTEKES